MKLDEIRTRIGEIQRFAAEEEGEPQRYRAKIIPIGVLTDDGRIFEDLVWRDPPLPLMATKTTSFGHDGAVLVGQIISFAKEKVDGETWVMGEIRWDEEDETSLDFKRLVDDGFLTSISADVAMLDYEVDVVYDEDGFVEDVTLIVHEGKVLGATIVPMPAFENAGFTAAGEPVKPPKEWFEDPGFERLQPLRVDGNRILGHLAPWNECHVGVTDKCVTAPFNETNYQLFLAAEIETAEGDMIPVGQITLSGGHADRGLNARAAAAHYDETKSAVADVTVGQDDHGIWFSGAIRPGITEAERRMLTASKLSGDWRPFKGDLELVAMLCVNSPGFPIARTLVASGKQQALFLTGLVADHADRLGQTLGKLELLVERIEMAEMKRMAAAIAASVES